MYDVKGEEGELTRERLGKRGGKKSTVVRFFILSSATTLPEGIAFLASCLESPLADSFFFLACSPGAPSSDR